MRTTLLLWAVTLLVVLGCTAYGFVRHVRWSRKHPAAKALLDTLRDNKRLFLLLATFLVLAPRNGLGTVKDMGHCNDVASAACPVRDYWPNVNEATGVESYWLSNTYMEVCFVTRQQYLDARIGSMFDCQWRRVRTQRSSMRGNNDSHQGLARTLDRTHPVDSAASLRVSVRRL